MQLLGGARLFFLGLVWNVNHVPRHQHIGILPQLLELGIVGMIPKRPGKKTILKPDAVDAIPLRYGVLRHKSLSRLLPRLTIQIRKTYLAASRLNPIQPRLAIAAQRALCNLPVARLYLVFLSRHRLA